MTKKKIKDIWKEIIDGKCTPGIDRLNLNYIQKNGLEKKYINLVYDGLINNKPYVFSKYKQLLKTKGRGKEPRVISIPTIRDRLMLSCLLNKIKFIYRPKVNDIVAGINSELNKGLYDSYLKLDITKFYDSINIPILISKLSEKLDKNTCDLIGNALLTNTVDEKNNTKSIPRVKSKRIGIPQGIIISNSLGEFYLKEFDHFMNTQKNIKYFRFVDDILIFYKSKEITKESILELASKEIKKCKLKFNKSKTESGLVSSPFEFLGYEFERDVIRPKKDSIRIQEKKIERIIFDFKNCTNSRMRRTELLKWKLDVNIRGFISQTRVYGWTQVYRKTNDLEVFYKMDWLVRKLLKRAGFEKKIFTSSYAKSYLYLTNNNQSYAINFDKKYKTISQKRTLLRKLFKVPAGLRSDVVTGLFNALVSKTIYDVERDLDFKYSLS